MKILLIIVFSFNFFSLVSPPEIIRGKVTNVFDGNTIELVTEQDEFYKIKLAGIDCPEVQQPFGPEAKNLLEKSVKGKKVEVFVQGKNRWGVRQAIVIPARGNDPRIKLLAQGLAWTSEKNANPEFESLRLDALTRAKGLWKDKDPIPPWIFRRQQTMLEPKYR
jgi:micrococcal nuclease